MSVCGEDGGRVCKIQPQRLIGGGQAAVKKAQIALFARPQYSDELGLVLRRIDQRNRPPAVIIGHDAHHHAESDIAQHQGLG